MEFNLERGKIPPQAVDLEQVVLGAALIDKKGVDGLFMVIRDANVFYKDAHRFTYKAIAALYEKGEPIDLLTVSQKLNAFGYLELVGGDFYLIKLTQKVASSAHIDFHCRILMQKFLKRQLIKLNNEIIALSYDESTDVFKILDKYQEQFDKVTDILQTGRRTISLKDSLSELKTNIERLSNQDEEVPLTGVPTGFKRTDKHTGGYKPQELIILAARPSMGKTAKALKTVIANLKINNPVAFFSLETSMIKLTARLVAIDSNFHMNMLVKHGFEKLKYFETYDEHSERIGKYPLFVDDSANSDVNDIIIMAKSWYRTHGIKLFVFDYLQLMSDRTIKGSNRELEVASISRKLKMLAKELNVPVLALAQLSRAVETRGSSKRPQLSDLRESGAIEQDADIIEFIYRPGYYGLEMLEDDYDDVKVKRAISAGANTEIIYAKFKDGATGIAPLQWIADKTKFIDAEDTREEVHYIDRPLVGIKPTEEFEVDNEKTVFDAQ